MFALKVGAFCVVMLLACTSQRVRAPLGSVEERLGVVVLQLKSVCAKPLSMPVAERAGGPVLCGAAAKRVPQAAAGAG